MMGLMTSPEHGRAEGGPDALSPRTWALPEWNLAPGEVIVTSKPCCVSTILGSCVAVCLHVPGRGVAAICHSVLPLAPKDGTLSRVERMRFMDTALDEMLGWLLERQVVKTEIRAKVFGGANVLPMCGDTRQQFHVGARNVETADAWLQRHAIPVDAREVGGVYGRKLHFNSLTGDVLMRRVGGDKP